MTKLKHYKPLPQILLIFCFSFLWSCKDDDVINKIPSYAITVDGEQLTLEDNSVFIKIRNGHSYGQSIQGSIVSNETVTHDFSIRYVGDITNPSSVTLIGALYYENDFGDSWSCFCANDMQLTITDSTEAKISGYLNDVVVTGDLGTKTISNIQFENLPIDKVDL